MGIQVAYIFLLDRQKAASPHDYGMQLPVQRVAPFYEPLNRDCRFAKLVYPDCTAYGFSFFKKSAMTDVLVLFTELSYDSHSELLERHSQRAAEILGDQEGEFYRPTYLRRALWIDESLEETEYKRVLRLFNGGEMALPNESQRQRFARFNLLQHRDGFIFTGPEEADFVRSLVLYSMGMAYHLQLSRQICRAAEVAGMGPEVVQRFKQEVYGFHAQYYFNNPVMPDHRDFYRAYRCLTERFALPDLLAEYQQKLGAISDFARVRSERGRTRPVISAPEKIDDSGVGSESSAAGLVPGVRSKRLFWVIGGVLAVVVLASTLSYTSF